MTSIRMLAAAMIIAAATLTACGGSKAKDEPAATPAAAAAPAYPSCKDDGHCAAQSQVCVAGTCKQCRDVSQCASLGACGRCDEATGTCVQVEGCCAIRDDCGGKQCIDGKCRN